MKEKDDEIVDYRKDDLSSYSGVTGPYPNAPSATAAGGASRPAAASPQKINISRFIGKVPPTVAAASANRVNVSRFVMKVKK